MKKSLLSLASVVLSTMCLAQQFDYPSQKDALKMTRKATKLYGSEVLHSHNLPAKNGSNILDITDTQIGQTYYDWQTNHGPINRTVAWEDGTLNACWTISVNTAFGDRGTAVAYFDGTSWTTGDARIENAKTGFGSIARYGANGLVVAAHTGNGILVSVTDDHTLKGEWTYNEFIPQSGSAWPTVMTSGENRDIIHILAASSDNQLYYYRSNDGGATWDINDHQLDYFKPPYASVIGSNSYQWIETTDDNKLAMLIQDGFSDGMVLYSNDDGDTWQRTQFYSHPGVESTFESIVFYPRYVAADWDEEGLLHIAYEFNGTTGAPGSGSYYPALGGIAYWNEDDYSVLDTTEISSIYSTAWYYSDATGDMPDNYIGYLCPLDEGGETYDPYNFQGDFGTSFLLESHGKYNNGIVGMPDFFIHNGRMFCFYIAVTQNAELDGVAYCRLYATNSQDGGETWTLPQILTKGMLHAYSEVVYPYTFDRIESDGVIRGFFQLDSQPGTYVQGDESVYDDNFMNAFAVTLDEIDGIKDNSSIVNELPEMSIYPNPVTSTMNIYLEKEALIMVHNVLGHKIAEFTHDGLGSNSFNVSALESGVYIVTAKAGNASNSLKLVVQ